MRGQLYGVAQCGVPKNVDKKKYQDERTKVELSKPKVSAKLQKSLTSLIEETGESRVDCGEEDSAVEERDQMFLWWLRFNAWQTRKSKHACVDLQDNWVASRRKPRERGL